MSDEVYQAIAQATSGFVESPAGCGKTEAIVRTVAKYCKDPQLVLTHTHAGVDALQRRFREQNVSFSKYHVDTIAGWSWGWVRRYPKNSDYVGSTEIVEWNDVYGSMSNLLQKDFVRLGILNSYAGIIVDEYQDCTVSMHKLITNLKSLLPCRVLGDDLQAVFGFHGEPLVDWSEVKAEFVHDLGMLQTPYRWLRANNDILGRWLLDIRGEFRSEREPDYSCAPIDHLSVRYADLARLLVRLTHEKTGRICVIGPKARPLPAGIETTLVKRKYHVLEPNELSVLRSLIIPLSGGSPTEKAEAALAFLVRLHGGLSENDKTFFKKILSGTKQRPKREDRRLLCEKHTSGPTPELVFDLLQYAKLTNGVSCKLSESASALKCIVEGQRERGAELKALYADEIAGRKHQGRGYAYRCIGSTLLVKGLEFDHAVILRPSNWQHSWGNYRDLYVALTRASRTTTLIELT